MLDFNVNINYYIFICKTHIRKGVREVEGATLEMLCGASHPGFESPPFRHNLSENPCTARVFYMYEASCEKQKPLISNSSGFRSKILEKRKEKP